MPGRPDTYNGVSATGDSYFSGSLRRAVRGTRDDQEVEVSATSRTPRDSTSRSIVDAIAQLAYLTA